jgi:hypothetical protein
VRGAVARHPGAGRSWRALGARCTLFVTVQVVGGVLGAGGLWDPGVVVGEGVERVEGVAALFAGGGEVGA